MKKDNLSPVPEVYDTLDIIIVGIKYHNMQACADPMSFIGLQVALFHETENERDECAVLAVVGSQALGHVMCRQLMDLGTFEDGLEGTITQYEYFHGDRNRLTFHVSVSILHREHKELDHVSPYMYKTLRQNVESLRRDLAKAESDSATKNVAQIFVNSQQINNINDYAL